jgi:hypothetical protein
MINSLFTQFKPELSTTSVSIYKKMLCIVEGQTELKYIYNLFRSFGFDGRCKELLSKHIKVSWGKTQVTVKNYCNFQGGSQDGSVVPRPAQEAFEFEKDNIELYSDIVVLFDSDKDKNEEVKNYFLDELNKIDTKSFLLSSKPCFEGSLIDYCRCGQCKIDIEKLDEENRPCDRYKNNFSKLNCFNGVGALIDSISKDDTKYLAQNHSQLLNLSRFIEDKIGL